MRKYFQILILVMAILILQKYSLVKAQNQASEQLIDVIDNSDGDIGLAFLAGSSITLSGDFKNCAREAFFYFIIVNKSNEDVMASFPRNVRSGSQYFPVDVSDYTCKKLGSNWTGKNFADANSGEKCVLSSNNFIARKGEAYSVRGRITGLSHELFRDLNTNSLKDTFALEFDMLIKNKGITGRGLLYEEGTSCHLVDFLNINKQATLAGKYFIDPTGQKLCSMNYYFIARNNDARYTTVIELPRWIDLEGHQYSIGCYYLYAGCNVSGFRHYAWGVKESPDQPYNDVEFYFCDQDYEVGNKCYEENGLWWLEIPPQKEVVIRGMVNSLCTGRSIRETGLENPLKNNYIQAGFYVSDAGSKKWWVGGEIKGRVPRATDASLLDFSQYLDLNGGTDPQIMNQTVEIPPMEISLFLNEMKSEDQSTNNDAPPSQTNTEQKTILNFLPTIPVSTQTIALEEETNQKSVSSVFSPEQSTNSKQETMSEPASDKLPFERTSAMEPSKINQPSTDVPSLEPNAQGENNLNGSVSKTNSSQPAIENQQISADDLARLSAISLNALPVAFSQQNVEFPSTGFPVGRLSPIKEQPAFLAYKPTGFTIEIPILNLAAPLTVVPMDQNNHWAVDWLGNEVGLLEGSDLPGEGIAFLSGHNHLNTDSAGPFAFLSSLQPNDRIFIRDSAGTLTQFKIYDNQLFPSDTMGRIYANLKVNCLALITCENEKIEGGYLNRRVIFAEPIS